LVQITNNAHEVYLVERMRAGKAHHVHYDNAKLL